MRGAYSSNLHTPDNPTYILFRDTVGRREARDVDCHIFVFKRTRRALLKVNYDGSEQ